MAPNHGCFIWLSQSDTGSSELQQSRGYSEFRVQTVNPFLERVQESTLSKDVVCAWTGVTLQVSSVEGLTWEQDPGLSVLLTGLAGPFHSHICP